MPTKGKKDKFEPLRWTLAWAASEFNIDPKTLAKRVKMFGLLPGDDEKWSTAQVSEAVFGSQWREGLRKTTEEADSYALDNAKQRRELVDLASLTALTNPIMAMMAQRIANLPCAQELKDEIRGDIAKLLVAIRPGPVANERGDSAAVADDFNPAAAVNDSGVGG